MRDLTARLLEENARDGKFEAMAGLADQLPVVIIAEMLGVSIEDRARFRAWSDAITSNTSSVPQMTPRKEVRDATAALRSYLAEQIERRRVEPGADLVSALVAAHDCDEVLSTEELLAFVVLLLIAGNATTTNLIAMVCWRWRGIRSSMSACATIPR